MTPIQSLLRSHIALSGALVVAVAVAALPAAASESSRPPAQDGRTPAASQSAGAQSAGAQPDSVAAPSLQIVWPPQGSTLDLGTDTLRSVPVIVSSNYRLMPAGGCGGDARCGHVHLKVDPDGDSCNLPGKAYNSMNSDFGGDLIKAVFGPCPSPAGEHVIGVLLADDRHKPVLVNGKPVTALIKVHTR